MKAVLDIPGVAVPKGVTTAYQLAKFMSGAGFDMYEAQASRLWKSKEFKRIALQTIADLCAAFDCTPNDLIKLTGKARHK
jgi:DNA-binding Xre family transcriptional regulator